MGITEYKSTSSPSPCSVLFSFPLLSPSYPFSVLPCKTGSCSTSSELSLYVRRLVDDASCLLTDGFAKQSALPLLSVLIDNPIRLETASSFNMSYFKKAFVTLVVVCVASALPIKREVPQG